MRWCQTYHLQGIQEGTTATNSVNYIIWPDSQGHVSAVLLVITDDCHIWTLAKMATLLPEGTYQPDYTYLSDTPNEQIQRDMLLGWQLAQYRYDRYLTAATATYPTLYMPESIAHQATTFYDAITLVRDLVNTPPCDMMPQDLHKAATTLSSQHQATCTVIDGDALKNEYPAIHTVGRASDSPPCLIDLRWGSEDAPRLTLVGKGVCFDSGGLDLKASSGMKLMKKDMGGAAHVLGLASLIMAHKLPVRLRVLVPAVENAVSGNAFRTSDVITMRNGSTVEVGNTDAEGRLILADALSDAIDEVPDLLIDCATLTGAARVALGTDIPAIFSNNDTIARELTDISQHVQDWLWHMPLHQPYAQGLKSKIADTSSTSAGRFGGAITAALFLQRFTSNNIPWMHIDMMAWNTSSRPGRPVGGEAMGLRALFAFLEQRYSHNPV